MINVQNIINVCAAADKVKLILDIHQETIGESSAIALMVRTAMKDNASYYDLFNELLDMSTANRFAMYNAIGIPLTNKILLYGTHTNTAAVHRVSDRTLHGVV